VTPKFAGKALLTLLTVSRSHSKPPKCDRMILTLSTTVTVGLVALFIYGKTTAWW
jgi:hypothetical protein